MKRIKSVNAFNEMRERIVSTQNPDIPTIVISAGTCGQTSGANYLIRVAKREILARDLHEKVSLRITGCHGFCEMEPSVLVEPRRTFYPKVSLTDMVRIVEAVSKGGVLEDLLFVDPATNEKIEKQDDIPFFKKQVRTILGRNEKIDPIRIYNYIEHGGYSSLGRALATGNPKWVLDEVKASGLRGRGGAGFPTGLKWEMLAKQPTVRDKFIICNADEGDPGAYMDRSILEGNPHSIIEGMIIGAYATGATKGVIYVRKEYPLAIKHLTIALRQAREFGLLGEDIMGTGFSFDIKLIKGAGAFVCGEETALMRSIEGEMGEPRQRPPFPSQKGINGNPTNINNAETWANISVIIDEGAEKFSKTGTKNNSGTKIFSLVGKIKHTGLVEVPMGTTISEIVYEIGGGPVGKEKIKAVQTGGPSGGCIPAAMFDLPIDYDSLIEAGSIMGSGGMIVMDESTCMVDLAKYFMNFLKDESCGKCFTCRKGTQRMHEILDDISRGRGTLEQLDLLEKLALVVKDTTLCGLGQTAPNPILSTLRYFRNEYEEHIKLKKCRAVVCKGLVEAPCSHSCPAGIDVPRYVRYLGEGKFKEALAVVREQLPFPAICGLVCFHPCESKCRRGMLDEPIAIRALKRASWEFGVEEEIAFESLQKTPLSGKKVAIVGAGPAGLTAAYYLAKKGGHLVTIFDDNPKPGGMLRMGIPKYRLPEDILDEEINRVELLGVKIQCGTHVDAAEKLLEQGFDAVFLALGANQGMRLGIEGEDLDGVMDGITFLRNVSLGNPHKVGESVAIVGGGNTAVDASRTALRLGAKKATLLYRRSRDEMPADPDEILEAEAEGVEFQYLTLPSRFTMKNGQLNVECIKMRLGKFDSSGRKQPVPIQGSEFSMKFDTVIIAVGQMPGDTPFKDHLQIDKRGRICIDPDTQAASYPGVFAGGDVVSGPASVIDAVAAAKLAAIAIDKYLGGKGDITEIFAPIEPKEPRELQEEEGERIRPAMPQYPVKKRTTGFQQVELGYTKEQAMEEAGRCLWCDLENHEYNQSNKEVDLKKSASA